MRIVVDTNVYISALVFNRKIQELLVNLLEDHTVIVSPFIMGELKRKLSQKFNFSKEDVELVTTQLSRITNIIIPEGTMPQVSKDTDDNNILLLADFAGADIIISGDKDLYLLKSYKQIPIIKPSDFDQ